MSRFTRYIVSIICFISWTSSFAIPKLPEITYSGTCFKQETQFGLLNTTGVDSVAWIFGDPKALLQNYSSGFQPSHVFTRTGDFTVTAIAYFEDKQVSVERFVTIIGPEYDLGNDTIVCDGKSYELSIPDEFSSYAWSTGATTNSIQISKAGTYTVEVEDNTSCVTSDTVTITLVLALQTTTINVETCVGQSKNITPGEFVQYQWFDGAEEASYLATLSGDYGVEVTSKEGCKYQITMMLDYFPEVDIEVESIDNYGNVLVNEIGGTPPYVFKLDTLSWSSSQVFSEVSYGDHQVYVKDDNSCIDSTYLNYRHDIVIPDYFSPNGDFINDQWFIVGLREQNNAVVKMYNRFGNFLLEFNPVFTYWDGQYNNIEAPSDTYWYILTYESEGQEITLSGKVLLKR